MELWIRSQDKMKLAREIDLRIVLEQEGASIIDETTDYILGTYKTKERALEVLDEIQKWMSKTLDSIIDQMDNCIVGVSTLVIYQMPEE